MNKAILIGNLTKDPEGSTTPNGIEVCKFNLAVARKFKNADGDRETDFLPIVCWRKTAELAVQYLSKGSKVAIIGNIQTRNYEAQDGSKRYITEIVAEEIEFLTTKRDSGDSEESDVKQSRKNIPLQELSPVDDAELPF